MASVRTLMVMYCLLILIIFLSVSSAKEEEEKEELETYIVHMDLSAMPKPFSTHHNWYLATINSFFQTQSSKSEAADYNSNHDDLRLLYTYTNSIHGFTALLSPTHLQFLQNSPGYVSHIKDLPVKVDTTHSSDFLGLNYDTGIWPVSDYGQNIVIGLVDTGIWPESKSFQDHHGTTTQSQIPSTWKGECENGTQFNSTMCNNKLIGARFFNKGLLSHSPNLTSLSMNSTRDTLGHGTHTSSTAAGNLVPDASYFGYAKGTARGTAPRARVAMYKAIWEEGAYMSDVIAAIDSAIQDGVDVISLSLGLDGIPMYQDPVAMATFAAVEKGIFVSTSAGNNGPFLYSLHNGIPWVLTVGAGTLDREFQGSVVFENENGAESVTGSTLYPGNWPLDYSVPIVFMDLCDDVKELMEKGKGRIVLCNDKTGNNLADQVDNVKNSGDVVAGGIFITNNTDLETFIMSTFPTLFVNPKQGQTILDYITSDNIINKARMEFHMTKLGTKPAPRVASYSSRGPSESCPFVLKPDLIAPGALILASWPDNVAAAVVTTDSKFSRLFSEFNLLSGTSMSCPHAAGVAALLKDVHPSWSPAAIRSAMMTTSYTMDNDLNYVEDMGNQNRAATPLDIGSGHIDPNRAMDPGLVYDLGTEDYINLLCGLNYTRKQIQTITKSSSYDHPCSSSTLDLNYPSFIAYFFNKNNDSKHDAYDMEQQLLVQEFERTVTNVGEGSASYVAKLSPMDDGLEVSVSPDKLIFKEKNEKQKYVLKIVGPRMMKKVIVHGSLTWIETQAESETEKDAGNNIRHIVRSPIVATNLGSQTLV